MNATWQVSTAALAAKWSATCYLTAHHIEEMLWADTPFGLIWASWGGTRVEAWLPKSGKESGCEETPNLPGPQAESSLYNGMIHPLTRYSLRGAIWFQGEHNIVTHSSRKEYGCAFGAMINQWRDAWRGIGDFPFLYAQLAPYTGYAKFAGHGDISIVRLAQADSLSHIGLDTTGMAVTIDLGDPKAPLGDVHSREKDPVAYRLALQAMHVMYAYQWGENVTNGAYPEKVVLPSLHYTGPELVTATLDSSTSSATLTFAHGDGMFLNDTMGCAIHLGIDFHGRLIGGECCKAHDTFQLCTGDLSNTTMLECVNATDVKIDGAKGTVTLGWGGVGTDFVANVWTDAAEGKRMVSEETTFTSVRYAYANYPQCAIYNSDKLPAGPFVASLTAAVVEKKTTAIKKKMVVTAASPVAPCQTPPMGLNSWNGFHCNVDERKMRAMADALVSTGLKDAGYEFVNIDDCWQVMRSANGSINADPTRFPGGIKPLADYVHSLGLKFGVYTAQHAR